ncbi:MAG: DUF4296 domain-containing protein [Bacteroidota bacterium]
MKKGLILITTLLVLCACHKSDEKIPEELIKREQLVPLLADLQYTEAIIQLKNLSYTDSTKAIAYGNYKYIFDKHHIEPATFISTFEWYKAHPKEMSELYKDVLTQLSKDAATKKP